MKLKKLVQIGIGSLLFLLLAFVSWQVFMNPINSEALTVEEVNQVATERFNGEIIDTKLVNDIYHITLKLDTGEYEIKISSTSGEIVEAIRTKKETPEKELAEEKEEKEKKEKKKEKEKAAENKDSEASKKSNNDEATDKKKEEPPRNITSEEAIQIALDTVYGEVDDVDLETENGQLYYFIEIETKDDLEAEIQIHSITGEVISIEWDD